MVRLQGKTSNLRYHTAVELAKPTKKSLVKADGVTGNEKIMKDMIDLIDDHEKKTTADESVDEIEEGLEDELTDEEKVDTHEGDTHLTWKNEMKWLDMSQDMEKRLKKAQKLETMTAGVVYLGRIPHGFFESQMRAYFSQFGKVTRLRLSRSKKVSSCWEDIKHSLT
jgi:hypothetical protein